MITNKSIINKFQQAIKSASTQAEKQEIAKELHAYIGTLSLDEQEIYKVNVISTIERKFEVMDKLIAAYEAIRKDDLVAAQ